MMSCIIRKKTQRLSTCVQIAESLKTEGVSPWLLYGNFLLWAFQNIGHMRRSIAESAPSIAPGHPATKPARVVELAQRSMEQVAHHDVQLQLDRDLRHVELFAGDCGLAWSGSASMGVARAAHLQRT
jgi:hypothetical protein